MRDLRRLGDGVLRSVSLVVTDRRWAAPLSGMALGFGIFLGVAIGPGAAGTLATDAGHVVAIAPSGGEEESATPESVEREPTGAAPEPEPLPPAPEAPEPALVEPELAPETFVEPEPEEDTPPSDLPTEEEDEAETETQRLKGTVVHANPAAGSYTMAIAGGELVSIHAPKLPPPGEKMTAEAAPLDNNTFAEEERERLGAVRQAALRGVVTYVKADPAGPGYALSGRGSSIFVHLPPSPSPQLPSLGAYAIVGVKIEKPAAEAPSLPEAEPADPMATGACAPDPVLEPPPPPKWIVVQRRLEIEPEPATYVDLAGIVSAVCPESGQLLLSADDLRASEEDLLLTVPGRFQTGKVRVGESIVATATIEDDGALTLAGLASDEGRRGAEAGASAQGDLKR